MTVKCLMHFLPPYSFLHSNHVNGQWDASSRTCVFVCDYVRQAMFLEVGLKTKLHLVLMTCLPLTGGCIWFD